MTTAWDSHPLCAAREDRPTIKGEPPDGKRASGSDTILVEAA